MQLVTSLLSSHLFEHILQDPSTIGWTSSFLSIFPQLHRSTPSTNRVLLTVIFISSLVQM